MKKKVVIIIVAVVALLGLCSCGVFGYILTKTRGDKGLESQESEIVNPDDLGDGQRTVITGRVNFYYDGDLFFTLRDGDQYYTIFLPESTYVSTGDYVKAEGVWEEVSNGLAADSVRTLNDEELASYMRSRHPYVEIEIVDYTANVGHTCDTPKFTLLLTNRGNETITHRDIHDYDYSYGFYYFIDDNWSKANADRDDYGDVMGQVGTDEAQLIGLLSNQGFMYFEDLEPGESTQVEYWAGGAVVRTEGGTAGSPNIFGNYPSGEYNVSFAWVDKNNYDPIVLSRSESVTVSLSSDKCDLGL